jgi:hypothetical protein
MALSGFLRMVYDSAALTPAVIVSHKPLRCLCIASLSSGAGGDYLGVRVMSGWELPETTIAAGKAVPCVSMFAPGRHPARWDDFTPRPIKWGTDDPAELSRCLSKIDAEDRQRLTDMYNRYRGGDCTDAGVSLWVLDPGGAIIERKKRCA